VSWSKPRRLGIDGPSHAVLASTVRTLIRVPRLWSETIEAHRREVQSAILDTAADLVDQRGLAGVTMSEIAEEAGIGRATLYKYFSDVEAILVAWHDRQVTAHLHHLCEVRDQVDASRRLEAVLEAYALIVHHTRGRHDGALGALLHRDDRAARGEHELRTLFRDLLEEAVARDAVRRDIAATELSEYCIHALRAARRVRSKSAVARIVTLVMAGLRP